MRENSTADVDLDAVVPALAAGGVAPTGEQWRFEPIVGTDLLDRATTCWVVPTLPDGRTAAVWMSSLRLHIPGGTVEAGEDWRSEAVRELHEELGAEIGSIDVFGAIVSDSRVRLTARAAITEPTGPGEPDLSSTHVLEVRLGTANEIIAALDADGQNVLADIYRLALLYLPKARQHSRRPGWTGS